MSRRVRRGQSSNHDDPEATMSAQLTSHRLRRAGADIHYEVRGTGPLLLVIGQPMTAEPFGPLADALADEHTVVTYDPRGVGRSTVDDTTADVTPEAEADDLAGIITELGGGPADVVGSSGGAVAGLALVARHPELVRRLVAHEPPLPELLPDAAAIRAAVDGIQEAYRAAGAGAAWGGFVSLVTYDGLVPDDGVPPASWPPPGMEGADGGENGGEPAAPPEPSAKQAADDELFFLRMLKPFTRWQPPVDALRAHGGVVVAVGQESHQESARRSGEALAERLGTTPVELPGGHGGFMGDAAGFAEAVRVVLKD
jgi:pimeloyl-ACP methyl ester carboxylesterase